MPSTMNVLTFASGKIFGGHRETLFRESVSAGFQGSGTPGMATIPAIRNSS